MQNPEYDILTKIAGTLHLSYSEKDAAKQQEWENSPFKWFAFDLTSRQKGAAGENLVAEFLTHHGFSVSKSPDSEADLVVDSHRVEVKCSTLWENGIYNFQQIRDQNYNILFCLGISPHDAHVWVVRKRDIKWNEISGQHKGKHAKDTWWIKFSPSQCPHTWLRPQNGDITRVCQELRSVLST